MQIKIAPKYIIIYKAASAALFFSGGMMAVSFMFVLAFFCCRFQPRRSVSVVFAAVVAIFNEAAIFFMVTVDFIETIFYIAVIAFCVRYCRLAAVLPEILRF